MFCLGCRPISVATRPQIPAFAYENRPHASSLFLGYLHDRTDIHSSRSRLKYSTGVNFRSFTQKKASSYGLTGYVRNTDNGRVQGEAQGDPESIEKLLKDINQGPAHAHVVRLEHDSIDDKTGESGFNTTS